jgi:hypothetical protein
VSWASEVIEPIEVLIARWTATMHEDALALLLPGWWADDGLTDGWHRALAAVEATAASPLSSTDEATMLNAVASHIRSGLANR